MPLRSGKEYLLQPIVEPALEYMVPGGGKILWMLLGGAVSVLTLIAQTRSPEVGSSTTLINHGFMGTGGDRVDYASITMPVDVFQNLTRVANTTERSLTQNLIWQEVIAENNSSLNKTSDAEVPFKRFQEITRFERGLLWQEDSRLVFFAQDRQNQNMAFVIDLDIFKGSWADTANMIQTLHPQGALVATVLPRQVADLLLTNPESYASIDSLSQLLITNASSASVDKQASLVVPANNRLVLFGNQMKNFARSLKMEEPSVNHQLKTKPSWSHRDLLFTSEGVFSIYSRTLVRSQQLHDSAVVLQKKIQYLEKQVLEEMDQNMFNGMLRHEGSEIILSYVDPSGTTVFSQFSWNDLCAANNTGLRAEFFSQIDHAGNELRVLVTTQTNIDRLIQLLSTSEWSSTKVTAMAPLMDAMSGADINEAALALLPFIPRLSLSQIKDALRPLQPESSLNTSSHTSSETLHRGENFYDRMHFVDVLEQRVHTLQESSSPPMKANVEETIKTAHSEHQNKKNKTNKKKGTSVSAAAATLIGAAVVFNRKSEGEDRVTSNRVGTPATPSVLLTELTVAPTAVSKAVSRDLAQACLHQDLEQFINCLFHIQVIKQGLTNPKHKKACEHLETALRDAATVFYSKPNNLRFIAFKKSCELAIQTAETAFSKDSGIWQNLLVPTLNIILGILNKVMSIIPCRIGLFEPGPTAAQTQWEVSPFKANLLKLLEGVVIEKEDKDAPNGPPITPV
jgi:hypothetical protein